MSQPAYSASMAKPKSSAFDGLSKEFSSNKTSYAALFLAGLGLILIVVLFILYATIPAPTSLSVKINQETASSVSPTPSVIPAMNNYYAIKSKDSDDGDSFMFKKVTKGYLAGVLYYAKNSNPTGGNSMTIFLEGGSSFTLGPQEMALLITDTNGVSRKSIIV